MCITLQYVSTLGLVANIHMYYTVHSTLRSVCILKFFNYIVQANNFQFLLYLIILFFKFITVLL